MVTLLKTNSLLKRVTLAATTILLVIPFFVIVMSSGSPVQAQTALKEPTKSEVSQAKKSIVAKWVRECVSSGKWYKPSKGASLQKPEWGDGSSKDAQTGFNTGDSILGSGPGLSCKDGIPQWVKSQLASDMSYLDIFCAMGAYPFERADDIEKNGGPTKKTCLEWVGEGGEVNITESGRVDSWLKEKIGTKLSDDALRYVEAYTLLKGRCSARILENTTANQVDEKNVRIKVARADGSVGEEVFFITDKSRRVAAGLFSASESRGDGDASSVNSDCESLAKVVGNYAQAYASAAGSNSIDQLRAKLAALCGKYSPSFGPNSSQNCSQRVSQWMEACKAKLPQSGSVASDEYIACIQEKSGISADILKEALKDIAAEETEGSNNEVTPTCGISDLGYFVCPTINFLAGVADAAFGFIAEKFLILEPGLASGDGVKQSWELTRNVANGVFIIIFLVIIISQILGTGLSK